MEVKFSVCSEIFFLCTVMGLMGLVHLDAEWAGSSSVNKQRNSLPCVLALTGMWMILKCMFKVFYLNHKVLQLCNASKYTSKASALKQN